MRTFLFILAIAFSSSTIAQSASFMTIRSATENAKKKSPAYSKKVMAKDAIVLRKAYPKIARQLKAKGAKPSEVDSAVITSLTKFRMASPNANLTPSSFQRKTLSFVKMVVNSIPEGASVEVLNINRDETDLYTTNASFWAIPSKYIVSATIDGFCAWEEEVSLPKSDEPFELQIEFESDCP